MPPELQNDFSRHPFSKRGGSWLDPQKTEGYSQEGKGALNSHYVGVLVPLLMKGFKQITE